MKRGVAQQRAEGFARRGYRVYLYSRRLSGAPPRGRRKWSYAAYADGGLEPQTERARLEGAGWRFERMLPPEPAQKELEPW